MVEIGWIKTVLDKNRDTTSGSGVKIRRQISFNRLHNCKGELLAAIESKSATSENRMVTESSLGDIKGDPSWTGLRTLKKYYPVGPVYSRMSDA
uniref:Uncharacterized protein n=1 Tax=Romanomermis culicivorax TaxID=13658 RepID=A0A915JK64_ROMCU